MRFLIGFAFLLAAVSATRAAGAGGKYSLWEDFEGGKVCEVVLTAEQTIGGYVFQGNQRCMKVFKFDGEPYAWFIDQEGWATIVDATRKILVRFEPHKDGSFYANRTADRLESLNLTRD
jgi:hypothetical protein